MGVMIRREIPPSYLLPVQDQRRTTVSMMWLLCEGSCYVQRQRGSFTDTWLMRTIWCPFRNKRFLDLSCPLFSPVSSSLLCCYWIAQSQAPLMVRKIAFPCVRNGAHSFLHTDKLPEHVTCKNCQGMEFDCENAGMKVYYLQLQR